MLPKHLAEVLLVDKPRIDAIFRKRTSSTLEPKETNSEDTSHQKNDSLAKLKSVVHSMQRSGICELYSVLGTAVKNALSSKRQVDFCGSEVFDAPQFRQPDAPTVVSKLGYVLLACDNTKYVYSDDYFKRAKFKASMVCELSKMPFSKNGMSYTGEDAIYFRRRQGIGLRLGVFCSVFPCNGFAKLIPYAIWRVGS